jgi:natural product precursor
MEKKIKKLSLNKETLVSLQERQMQSLIGGAALMSDGPSSGYTCATKGTCTPIPVEVSNSCINCVPKLGGFDENVMSCCKKTCND